MGPFRSLCSHSNDGKRKVCLTSVLPCPLISEHRLDSVEKPKRAELLAYAALTGAYIAVWKGYYVIAPKLLATARKMVTQAGAAQGGAAVSTLAPFAPNIAACSLLLTISTQNFESVEGGISIGFINVLYLYQKVIFFYGKKIFHQTLKPPHKSTPLSLPTLMHPHHRFQTTV